VEGDIETLKTELHDALERLQSPAPDAGKNANAAGGAAEKADGDPPLVYIICHKTDRAADHLKSLRKLLFDRGCEPKLPREDGTEEEIAKAHVDRLAECDAFVIYYGAGSEGWLDDRLTEFTRHLRARKKPIKAKVVYLAPPKLPHKDEVITHEASILNSDELFRSDIFEPFLQALNLANRK
jgi:hypothetical protein